MKKNKIMISLFLICLLSINFIACIEKKREQNKTSLDVYVDLQDRHSVKIVDFLIKSFEEKNQNIKINMVNPMNKDNNIMKTIDSGKNVDLIISNMQNVLFLQNKGLISDFTQQYNNFINDKYYQVYISYSKIGGMSYGIGITPYTIELAYNKEECKKLIGKEPKDVNDYLLLLKICKDKGIKVPYLLNEDLDIGEVLFGIFNGDNVKQEELINDYSDKIEDYAKIKGFNETFKLLNKYVKSGYVSENSFEKIDEKDIDKFISGKSPVLITTSFFSNKLNKGNISLLKEMGMIGETKILTPVYMNSFICSLEQGTNKEQKDKFIEYITSEEVQKQLVENGYITANKVANKKFTGISGEIVEHLYGANATNIIYKGNVTVEVDKKIKETLEKILTGQYSENIWKNSLIQK